MKTPVLVISAVLVSLLAVSRSEVITEDNVAMPYSVIDPIIKAILEGMRPKLANLTVEDINEEINTPKLNASVSVSRISVLNVDTFVIKSLKSTIAPLRLTNLTLTWDRILGSASYDVDANLVIPQVNAPVRLYGRGDARAVLSEIFLTIGANMELKGKTVQIKPKGLFGFDIFIRNANVSLTSLMGNPELGRTVGEFISRIIPDVVNTLKKPVFDAFHDTIVTVINQVLKDHKGLLMDELPETSSEDFDSSEEFDSFPIEPLDLDSKETEFEA